MIGTIAFTCAASSTSPSTPFSRLALTRRSMSRMSCSVWPRFSTPRWLNITLKLSSCDEPFPELHRLLVEVRRLVPQVVGADDRRVAPGVAAADPALLEHGDVGDAVLLGEVVRGREPVPAAADDDDVVLALRLGAAPRLLPPLVVGERVAGEAPDRIAVHAWPDGEPASAAGRSVTPIDRSRGAPSGRSLNPIWAAAPTRQIPRNNRADADGAIGCGRHRPPPASSAHFGEQGNRRQ